MKENIKTVETFYNENAEYEWNRLKDHPFEFIFTTYMMDKYIKAGDKVLDIGGGPGRYSLYLASKGCDVTLIDLAKGNVDFALKMAKEEKLNIKSFVSNCLDIDDLDLGMYDHILIMGPLYHLVDKKDQHKAIDLAIKHLVPGGKIYISFILNFSAIIFDLKNGDYIINDMKNPSTGKIIDNIINDEEYTGPAFTTACFTTRNKILDLMCNYDLEMLHLFGQEGFLAPNENDVLKRSEEEQKMWIELGKKLLELPELLAYSEHAMYIGKKMVK